MMTLQKVKDHIARIASMADDDESAHVEEDRLYRDVLEAIAKGQCEDPAACAAEALKTKLIDFARWCA